MVGVFLFSVTTWVGSYGIAVGMAEFAGSGERRWVDCSVAAGRVHFGMH